MPWVGSFAGQAAPSAGWVGCGQIFSALYPGALRVHRTAVRLRVHTLRLVRASTWLVPSLCARLPTYAGRDRESQSRRTANRCSLHSLYVLLVRSVRSVQGAPSKERRGNAKIEEAIACLRQHGVGFVVSPRSIGIEVRFSLTHLTLELRYTPPLVFVLRCRVLPCAHFGSTPFDFMCDLSSQCGWARLL